jgi:CRP-like cAMP-binding protein
MDINLTLTAKKWQLASQLQRTSSYGGVQVVKNIPERTYLTITSKQWVVLEQFGEARTVPQVLESAITERFSPALGEFYEIILKAVRARILVEPGQTTVPVMAASWPLSLRMAYWSPILWVMLLLGLGVSVYFRPLLPLGWQDAAIGTGLALLAGLVGASLGASLLRGAKGEVYLKRWFICTDDACMLPPEDQRTVAVGPLSFVALTAGLLCWLRPEWAIPPLAFLFILGRPFLRARMNAIIRVGAQRRLNDASHHFIFPPNRSVRNRVKLLALGLRSATTWLEVAYGVVWTLLLAYFFGELSEMPPWKLAFWQTLGPRLGLAAAGSLGLLALIYLGLEIYVFARDHARRWKEWLVLTFRRWCRRGKLPTDEAARLRALLASPALRLLPPQVQQPLAKAFRSEELGPWKPLPLDGRFGVILSGEVGVYRLAQSGRRVLVQVLGEGDLVGLHDLADPARPDSTCRTLTPVHLLLTERAPYEAELLARMPLPALTHQVRIAPFLSRISLCASWHRQAVQRFAELSLIKNYADKEVILEQGFFSESFFIILEGEAQIIAGQRRLAVIGRGSYFGEIGLLQNSNSVARVVAQTGTRCLCVPRKEFMRFVTHNHTVALELERVSSKRLGHPIFPLTPGNFRAH